MAHTPGPWFVSGVRFRMNGGEYLSINRYDEANKRDDNIACVAFDKRNGAGMADANLIAAGPDLLAALKAYVNLPTNHEGRPIGTRKLDDLADAAIRKAETGR